MMNVNDEDLLTTTNGVVSHNFISSLVELRGIIGDIPSRNSVFLVSTLDIDAVCCFHILSSLYKSDRFYGSYSAYLVSNNEDIKKQVDDNDDKSIFFLLNCGSQFKEFDLYSDKHFFILDCKRPFYLCNVFKSLQKYNNVHILVDRMEELNPRYSYIKKSLEEEQDLSEMIQFIKTLTVNENNNEVIEDNYEDDEDLKDFIVEDEEEENQMEDDEEDSFQKSSAFEDDKEDEMENDDYYASTKEERILLYNNGDGYSLPSAYLLYSLLDSFDVTISMRWSAIISITSHYLFDKCNEQEYNEYYIKISNDLGNSFNHFKVVDGITIPLDDDYIKNNFKELNIELLKQWNVYDSFLNSTRISLRFNTWNNQGIEDMKLFISDLGITLNEAKTNWCSLPNNVKETLYSKLLKKKNAYNLFNITFNSFERYFEQSFSLTASDQMFALLGIMQVIPQNKLLTVLSNCITNAKECKQIIENGITKTKQMREAMRDVFKMVMENKAYYLTQYYIAIDLTGVNLSSFNMAMSASLHNDGTSSSELSPIAFYQLAQYFMKLTKGDKVIGRVHVILMTQQNNYLYVCGLHQQVKKQRTFNRAFEFACNTFTIPLEYSLFDNHVKVIQKERSSEMISVLLGALMKK
ncbi:hypothetical protein ABK040_010334 [Willaertia magna]